MIQTIHVFEEMPERLMTSLNNKLKRLQEEGNKIVDIKYGNTSGTQDAPFFGALIVYSTADDSGTIE